jgi:hypothetical protein
MRPDLTALDPHLAGAERNDSAGETLDHLGARLMRGTAARALLAAQVTGLKSATPALQTALFPHAPHPCRPATGHLLPACHRRVRQQVHGAAEGRSQVPAGTWAQGGQPGGAG